jgi:hypothetical protein
LRITYPGLHLLVTSDTPNNPVLLLLLLQVMDKHLDLLCRQHLETKFVKVRGV